MLKTRLVLYLFLKFTIYSTDSLKRHTAIKGHSSAMTALSTLHSPMILPEEEHIPGTIIVRK